MIFDVVFKNGIVIEYVCEKLCVCIICYCIVWEGFDLLEESDELEDDMLDKVWGLELEFCFSC